MAARNTKNINVHWDPDSDSTATFIQVVPKGQSLPTYENYTYVPNPNYIDLNTMTALEHMIVIYPCIIQYQLPPPKENQQPQTFHDIVYDVTFQHENIIHSGHYPDQQHSHVQQMILVPLKHLFQNFDAFHNAGGTVIDVLLKLTVKDRQTRFEHTAQNYTKLLIPNMGQDDNDNETLHEDEDEDVDEVEAEDENGDIDEDQDQEFDPDDAEADAEADADADADEDGDDVTVTDQHREEDREDSSASVDDFIDEEVEELN